MCTENSSLLIGPISTNQMDAATLFGDQLDRLALFGNQMQAAADRVLSQPTKCSHAGISKEAVSWLYNQCLC